MSDGAPDERETAQAAKGMLELIEFPDLAAAVAFYESAGYQAAASLRQKCAEADILLTEGVGALGSEGDPAGKAFMVARMRVHDATRFAEFSKAAMAALRSYNGTLLARNAKPDERETARGATGLIFLAEFPDTATAVEFYESPEYQSAIQIRLSCSAADVLLSPGLAS